MLKVIQASLLITLMFLAVGTKTSYGQKSIGGDQRSRFYVGPKAGYNLANVYDTQGENFDAESRVGFVAGVFFSIPIGKMFGFQPEILFSQKGFQANGTVLGSPYALSRTINYIDLPILFSVKPGRVVTLLAGPQFSYLIRQRDVFENTTVNNGQVQGFQNENIRKNSLCFLGGIDFNFNHFVLGTRLGWDISHNNGESSSTAPRYKNVWIQATIAYRL